jgi:WD40 repeat protein
LGHSGGTLGISYSPDGSILATGGKDNYLRIWNAVTGELMKQLDFEGGGQSVEFSANGRWLVAGNSSSSRVVVWETRSWKELTPPDLNAKVGRKTWCVHFCDADRRLAVSGHSGLRLLEVKSNPDFSIQEIEEDDQTLLSSSRVSHLVSDDSKLFWLQSNDSNSPENQNGVYMFRLAERTPPKGRHMLEKAEPGLFGLAVHPAAGLFYSDRDSGNIKRRSPDGRKIDNFLSRSTDHIKFHPHEPWVAIQAGSRGFEIWNWQTGKRILKFPQRDTTVWFLSWNPVRNQLAVARSGGAVELWDIDSVQAELSKVGLKSATE